MKAELTGCQKVSFVFVATGMNLEEILALKSAG